MSASTVCWVPRRDRRVMSFLSWVVLASLLCLLQPITATLQAQEAQPAAEEQTDYPPPQVNWNDGPLTARLGDVAKVELSAQYTFLDGDQTRKLMEAYGNFPTNTEKGLIARADNRFGWFVVFEFDDVGYVKDDEKDSLDAPAMLESFLAGNKESNKERMRLGMPPLELVGWKSEPRYDPQSNDLEWCLHLQSEGESILNHNIRLLGRYGVMRVTLVCDPSELDSALHETRQLLQQYEFLPGNRYAEWTAGDKVAQYGLTALVTGGAVALAAKTGVLQKLLKPLIFVVVIAVGAISAFFKKVWAMITGKTVEAS